MKLPIVLYMLLVFFNLLCLYFIIGLLGWGSMEIFFVEEHRTQHARFMAYLLYVTLLLNLYALCYIAIRKIFKS